MTGKTVYRSEEASPSISVKDLPSGIYFLQIQNLNNYHYETHKIIIEP
ncbi:MAG: T9SS type A sorting domain-containing protein [Bacteroidetes bacterium]|nr:T9SS type A sorting domain-containing protein [Bacteroidota bacterium]